MKIYERVVIDMSTGQVLEESSFEHNGPVAECKDSPSPPPPPDYSGIAASNEQAAQLAANAAANDLAFRQQVYQESLPRQQQLSDLANQVIQQQLGIGNFTQNTAQQQYGQYNNLFQPVEAQTVLDSMGAQYLSPEEMQQLQGVLNNPNMSAADRASILNGLSRSSADRQANEVSQGYLTAGQTAADRLAQLRASGVAGLQDVQGQGVQRLQGLRDAQLGYLNNVEQQQRQAIPAYINNAYAQQARNLTRMGGDPNRIAAAAQQIAGQQALTNVGGINQLSRDFGAMRNSITDAYGQQQFGLEQGIGQQIQALNQQYGQQQAALQSAADEAARAAQAGRYGQGLALRSGVANFGRNMPNTAAQSFGLALQGGNSAVQNQLASYQSALPYAQYQSGATANQLGAAGLQQQGALGLGGLMNNSYSNQLNSYNAQLANQASGLAGLGQFAGMIGSAWIGA